MLDRERFLKFDNQAIYKWWHDIIKARQVPKYLFFKRMKGCYKLFYDIYIKGEWFFTAEKCVGGSFTDDEDAWIVYFDPDNPIYSIVPMDDFNFSEEEVENARTKSN